MKKATISSAVLALLGSSQVQAYKKITIDPSTRTLRDEHDRQATLHGVNVVYKVDPYLPIEDKFDAQDSLSD